MNVPAMEREEKRDIEIEYGVRDGCLAAQWLNKEQTLGGNYPYLFTQCQAIHARTLMPCQDTPADKFTFEAKVYIDALIQTLDQSTKAI